MKLVISLFFLCISLKSAGQIFLEFIPNEVLSNKEKKEFYTLLSDGTFIYSLRIKGLSIGFESSGYWEQVSKDSILLNSSKFKGKDFSSDKIKVENTNSTFQINYIIDKTKRPIF
jgi:hypothetical protein